MPSPRKTRGRRPRPVAPGRCQPERALAPREETDISRGQLPSLCPRLSIAAGARAPPLGLMPPKLISRTCQFALVWKRLKNLEICRGHGRPRSPQFCLARAVGRSRGCGVCLEPTSQTRSPAPPRPSPKLPDAPRRPGRARCSCVTSPPAPPAARRPPSAAGFAPGCTGASRPREPPSPRRCPFGGECELPSRGRRPSRRCSARGQVQRAPGRGKRARGAPLTFGCLQISRGRCSAGLGHVSPRSLASLARHGALRAGHPRRGSPGSRGGRLGSGDLAGCAPAARPLHRRRPGPPGPAGPRAAARVPPARLSDARGEAAAWPAPGMPARSLARGAAEAATATRLRAPPMSSFTAIVSGEISEQRPGGGGGDGEGAGGKSLPPPPGPSYSAEPGGRRTGRRSRAPAACAPGWH